MPILKDARIKKIVVPALFLLLSVNCYALNVEIPNKPDVFVTVTKIEELRPNTFLANVRTISNNGTGNLERIVDCENKKSTLRLRSGGSLLSIPSSEFDVISEAICKKMSNSTP